jgi:hypothetical protein
LPDDVLRPIGRAKTLILDHASNFIA